MNEYKKRKEGNISRKECIENGINKACKAIFSTLFAILGGMAGGAIGTHICPVVGTIIGGHLGGHVGREFGEAVGPFIGKLLLPCFYQKVLYRVEKRVRFKRSGLKIFWQNNSRK